MITGATISVLGVIIVLVSAVGFFAMSEKKPGRGLYALMLFFALIHLTGDGILRSTACDPANTAMQSMSGFQVFSLVLFLIGVVGTLQMGIDIIWYSVRKKAGAGIAVLTHLPAVILAIVTLIAGDSLMAPVLRYIPLLFTLVLFFLLVWFFEKIDKGIRIALIVTIIGCVLMFISNQILHITTLPLLVPVLLMVIGFSWNGRSVVADEEQLYEDYRKVVTASDDSGEKPRIKPKAERLEIPEQTEPVISATQITYSPPVAEDGTVTSDTMTTIELSELEELMQKAEIGESILQMELEPDPVPMPHEQLQEMHNLPLMMEKDLNEYYRQMHESIVQKNYDTCRNILNETFEFRISGIHVTRYERIRHAIEDKDWKTAEKELKSF